MASGSQPTPLFVLRGVKSGEEPKSELEVTALSSFGGDRQGALLYGTSGGSIILCGTQDRKILTKWFGHQHKGIIWLGALPNGAFASFGRDRTLKVWEIQCDEAKETKTYRTEYIGFCACDVFTTVKGQNMIALPESNATVKIINLDDDQTNTVLRDDKSDNVTCLRFFPDGLESGLGLLVGYESGYLAAWDIASGSVIAKTCTEKGNAITCVDFESTSKRGISCSVGTAVRIWHLENGSFQDVATKEIINPGVACVRIRQDAKIVALGGWDCRIRLFSWRTMKPLAVLDFHRATVQTLLFFQANSVGGVVRYHLAAGSGDGCISFWDLYNS